MNQYDYSGYQFGSVVCVEWSMEFCGSESRSRIHSAFPTEQRLHNGTVSALVRRSLDPEQSDWSKSRLIAFRTGASGQNEVLGNEC